MTILGGTAGVRYRGNDGSFERLAATPLEQNSVIFCWEHFLDYRPG